MASIAGLDLGGKHYMIMDLWICICLQLLLYYSFIQYLYRFVFLSFCVTNGGLMYSHMLAKMNSLVSALKFALREQQPCHVDKAYQRSVYQQGEKKNRVYGNE